MPRLELAVVYTPRPADGTNRFDRFERMVEARYPAVRPDETGDQRRTANPTPRFRTGRMSALTTGSLVEWGGERFRVTNVRRDAGTTGTKVWLDTELYSGPVWYFVATTVRGAVVTVGTPPRIVGAFRRAA